MTDHQAARDAAANVAYPDRHGGTDSRRTNTPAATPVAIIGAIGVNGVRPDWQAEAACRGMGTDIFFSERGDSRPVAAAKAICATCPVADECLQWAIDTGCRVGIFGGKTPRERQGLKYGSYRPVKCGTTAGFARHYRLGEQPCQACAEARRAYQRGAQAAYRGRQEGAA